MNLTDPGTTLYLLTPFIWEFDNLREEVAGHDVPASSHSQGVT